MDDTDFFIRESLKAAQGMSSRHERLRYLKGLLQCCDCAEVDEVRQAVIQLTEAEAQLELLATTAPLRK